MNGGRRDRVAADFKPSIQMTMTFDPEACHRRSVRLRGYDYARSGLYFLTRCTRGKEHLFGEVVEWEMRSNALGEVARREWYGSARIREEIELDEFVVMPNHLHAIVRIVGADGVRPYTRQKNRS